MPAHLIGNVQLDIPEPTFQRLENLVRRMEQALRDSSNVTQVTRTPGRTDPSFAHYDRNDVVSRSIAAKLLAVSSRTFEDWAVSGRGPCYRKLGTGRSARVVYQIGDLLDWLNSNRKKSTIK